MKIKNQKNGQWALLELTILDPQIHSYLWKEKSRGTSQQPWIRFNNKKQKIMTTTYNYITMYLCKCHFKNNKK